MPEHQVPVNLVCGPLGIGKTTAIISYLKRTRSSQFTAVLVNDFGPVGMDAAIMESELAPAAHGGTSIKMLPGGCVCCTSVAGLLGAMQELRAMPRLDRIIIEPSGLAMVGDMVDLVSSIAQEYGLALRPVITLVEPRLIDRPGFLKAPYYVRMVEAADVLVANRCDLASADQLARFDEWAGGLYPPKLSIIRTTHGEIPAETFDLVAAHRAGSGTNGVRRPHTEDQYAGGCLFGAEVVFDSDKVEQLLRRMAHDGFAGNEVLRLKGILHTAEGWRLYEIAGGVNHVRPTDYRRDSRIDWITQGVPILDAAVKEKFEEARVKVDGEER